VLGTLLRPIANFSRRDRGVAAKQVRRSGAPMPTVEALLGASRRLFPGTASYASTILNCEAPCWSSAVASRTVRSMTSRTGRIS